MDVLDAQVHLFDRGPRGERLNAMLGERDAEMRQRVLAHYSRATLNGFRLARTCEMTLIGAGGSPL